VTAEVDEISSDAFLKVETHGIDAIPDAERHGRPRELGFLWAGAFVNYASLLTASLLTTYYGLGVWDGLLAVLIGTLAGAVILGFSATLGRKAGSPRSSSRGASSAIAAPTRERCSHSFWGSAGSPSTP